jgi:hypothetical protein
LSSRSLTIRALCPCHRCRSHRLCRLRRFGRDAIASGEHRVRREFGRKARAADKKILRWCSGKGTLSDPASLNGRGRRTFRDLPSLNSFPAPNSTSHYAGKLLTGRSSPASVRTTSRSVAGRKRSHESPVD